MSAFISLGLTATGADALAARLLTLSAAVRRKALLKVLRAAAGPIQGRAAELAPIDPRLPRHLKDAIVISPVPVTELPWTLTGSDEFQAAVAVGPARDVFWGSFVEFGTVKMAARPFLRPAFDYGSDRALTILRDGLWALLDAANRGTGIFEREDTHLSTTSGLL